MSEIHIMLRAMARGFFLWQITMGAGRHGWQIIKMEGVPLMGKHAPGGIPGAFFCVQSPALFPNLGTIPMLQILLQTAGKLLYRGYRPMYTTYIP